MPTLGEFLSSTDHHLKDKLIRAHYSGANEREIENIKERSNYFLSLLSHPLISTLAPGENKKIQLSALELTAYASFEVFYTHIIQLTLELNKQFPERKKGTEEELATRESNFTTAASAGINKILALVQPGQVISKNFTNVLKTAAARATFTADTIEYEETKPTSPLGTGTRTETKIPVNPLPPTVERKTAPPITSTSLSLQQLVENELKELTNETSNKAIKNITLRNLIQNNRGVVTKKIVTDWSSSRKTTSAPEFRSRVGTYITRFHKVTNRSNTVRALSMVGMTLSLNDPATRNILAEQLLRNYYDSQKPDTSKGLQIRTFLEEHWDAIITEYATIPAKIRNAFNNFTASLDALNFIEAHKKLKTFMPDASPLNKSPLKEEKPDPAQRVLKVLEEIQSTELSFQEGLKTLDRQQRLRIATLKHAEESKPRQAQADEFFMEFICDPFNRLAKKTNPILDEKISLTTLNKNLKNPAFIQALATMLDASVAFAILQSNKPLSDYLLLPQDKEKRALEEYHKARNAGFPSGSYLITPIQRPPRYILLLTELIKAAKEEGEPTDNIRLLEANLETIKNIVAKINEANRTPLKMACENFYRFMTKKTGPEIKEGEVITAEHLLNRYGQLPPLNKERSNIEYFLQEIFKTTDTAKIRGILKNEQLIADTVLSLTASSPGGDSATITKIKADLQSQLSMVPSALNKIGYATIGTEEKEASLATRDLRNRLIMILKQVHTIKPEDLAALKNASSHEKFSTEQLGHYEKERRDTKRTIKKFLQSLPEKTTEQKKVKVELLSKARKKTVLELAFITLESYLVPPPPRLYTIFPESKGTLDGLIQEVRSLKLQPHDIKEILALMGGEFGSSVIRTLSQPNYNLRPEEIQLLVSAFSKVPIDSLDLVFPKDLSYNQRAEAVVAQIEQWRGTLSPRYTESKSAEALGKAFDTLSLRTSKILDELKSGNVPRSVEQDLTAIEREFSTLKLHQEEALDRQTALTTSLYNAITLTFMQLAKEQSSKVGIAFDPVAIMPSAEAIRHAAKIAAAEIETLPLSSRNKLSIGERLPEFVMDRTPVALTGDLASANVAINTFFNQARRSITQCLETIKPLEKKAAAQTGNELKLDDADNVLPDEKHEVKENPSGKNATERKGAWAEKAASQDKEEPIAFVPPPVDRPEADDASTLLSAGRIPTDFPAEPSDPSKPHVYTGDGATGSTFTAPTSAPIIGDLQSSAGVENQMSGERKVSGPSRETKTSVPAKHAVPTHETKADREAETKLAATKLFPLYQALVKELALTTDLSKEQLLSLLKDTGNDLSPLLNKDELKRDATEVAKFLAPFLSDTATTAGLFKEPINNSTEEKEKFLQTPSIARLFNFLPAKAKALAGIFNRHELTRRLTTRNRLSPVILDHSSLIVKLGPAKLAARGTTSKEPPNIFLASLHGLSDAVAINRIVTHTQGAISEAEAKPFLTAWKTAIEALPSAPETSALSMALGDYLDANQTIINQTAEKQDKEKKEEADKELMDAATGFITSSLVGLSGFAPFDLTQPMTDLKNETVDFTAADANATKTTIRALSATPSGLDEKTPASDTAPHKAGIKFVRNTTQDIAKQALAQASAAVIKAYQREFPEDFKLTEETSGEISAAFLIAAQSGPLTKPQDQLAIATAAMKSPRTLPPGELKLSSSASTQAKLALSGLYESLENALIVARQQKETAEKTAIIEAKTSLDNAMATLTKQLNSENEFKDLTVDLRVPQHTFATTTSRFNPKQLKATANAIQHYMKGVDEKTPDPEAEPEQAGFTLVRQAKTAAATQALQHASATVIKAYENKFQTEDLKPTEQNLFQNTVAAFLHAAQSESLDYSTRIAIAKKVIRSPDEKPADFKTLSPSIDEKTNAALNALYKPLEDALTLARQQQEIEEKIALTSARTKLDSAMAGLISQLSSEGEIKGFAINLSAPQSHLATAVAEFSPSELNDTATAINTYAASNDEKAPVPKTKSGQAGFNVVRQAKAAAATQALTQASAKVIKAYQDKFNKEGLKPNDSFFADISQTFVAAAQAGSLTLPSDQIAVASAVSNSSDARPAMLTLSSPASSAQANNALSAFYNSLENGLVVAKQQKATAETKEQEEKEKEEIEAKNKALHHLTHAVEALIKHRNSLCPPNLSEDESKAYTATLNEAKIKFLENKLSDSPKGVSDLKTPAKLELATLIKPASNSSTSLNIPEFKTSAEGVSEATKAREALGAFYLSLTEAYQQAMKRSDEIARKEADAKLREAAQAIIDHHRKKLPANGSLNTEYDSKVTASPSYIQDLMTEFDYQGITTFQRHSLARLMLESKDNLPNGDLDKASNSLTIFYINIIGLTDRLLKNVVKAKLIPFASTIVDEYKALLTSNVPEVKIESTVFDNLYNKFVKSVNGTELKTEAMTIFTSTPDTVSREQVHTLGMRTNLETFEEEIETNLLHSPAEKALSITVKKAASESKKFIEFETSGDPELKTAIAEAKKILTDAESVLLGTATDKTYALPNTLKPSEKLRLLHVIRENHSADNKIVSPDHVTQVNKALIQFQNEIERAKTLYTNAIQKVTKGYHEADQKLHEAAEAVINRHQADLKTAEIKVADDNFTVAFNELKHALSSLTPQLTIDEKKTISDLLNASLDQLHQNTAPTGIPPSARNAVNAFYKNVFDPTWKLLKSKTYEKLRGYAENESKKFMALLSECPADVKKPDKALFENNLVEFNTAALGANPTIAAMVTYLTPGATLSYELIEKVGISKTIHDKALITGINNLLGRPALDSLELIAQKKIDTTKSVHGLDEVKGPESTEIEEALAKAKTALIETPGLRPHHKIILLPYITDSKEPSAGEKGEFSPINDTEFTLIQTAARNFNDVIRATPDKIAKAKRRQAAITMIEQTVDADIKFFTAQLARHPSPTDAKVITEKNRIITAFATAKNTFMATVRNKHDYADDELQNFINKNKQSALLPDDFKAIGIDYEKGFFAVFKNEAVNYAKSAISTAIKTRADAIPSELKSELKLSGPYPLSPSDQQNLVAIGDKLITSLSSINVPPMQLLNLADFINTTAHGPLPATDKIQLDSFFSQVISPLAQYYHNLNDFKLKIKAKEDAYELLQTNLQIRWANWRKTQFLNHPEVKAIHSNNPGTRATIDAKLDDYVSAFMGNLRNLDLDNASITALANKTGSNDLISSDPGYNAFNDMIGAMDLLLADPSRDALEAVVSRKATKNPRVGGFIPDRKAFQQLQDAEKKLKNILLTELNLSPRQIILLLDSVKSNTGILIVNREGPTGLHVSEDTYAQIKNALLQFNQDINAAMELGLGAPAPINTEHKRGPISSEDTPRAIRLDLKGITEQVIASEKQLCRMRSLYYGVGRRAELRDIQHGIVGITHYLSNPLRAACQHSINAKTAQIEGILGGANKDRSLAKEPDALKNQLGHGSSNVLTNNDGLIHLLLAEIAALKKLETDIDDLIANGKQLAAEIQATSNPNGQYYLPSQTPNRPEIYEIKPGQTALDAVSDVKQRKDDTSPAQSSAGTISSELSDVKSYIKNNWTRGIDEKYCRQNTVDHYDAEGKPIENRRIRFVEYVKDRRIVSELTKVPDALYAQKTWLLGVDAKNNNIINVMLQERGLDTAKAHALIMSNSPIEGLDAKQTADFLLGQTSTVSLRNGSQLPLTQTDKVRYLLRYNVITPKETTWFDKHNENYTKSSKLIADYFSGKDPAQIEIFLDLIAKYLHTHKEGPGDAKAIAEFLKNGFERDRNYYNAAEKAAFEAVKPSLPVGNRTSDALSRALADHYRATLDLPSHKTQLRDTAVTYVNSFLATNSGSKTIIINDMLTPELVKEIMAVVALRNHHISNPTDQIRVIDEYYYINPNTQPEVDKEIKKEAGLLDAQGNVPRPNTDPNSSPGLDTKGNNLMTRLLEAANTSGKYILADSPLTPSDIGKLFVEVKTGGGALIYQVINSAGQKITGHINQNEMKEVKDFKATPPHDFAGILPAILKITTARGHTVSADPLHKLFTAHIDPLQAGYPEFKPRGTASDDKKATPDDRKAFEEQKESYDYEKERIQRWSRVLPGVSNFQQNAAAFHEKAKREEKIEIKEVKEKKPPFGSDDKSYDLDESTDENKNEHKGPPSFRGSQ
jgi:hypothetical protein